MHRLRVGIVEAQEIYRRGLEAALADDSGIALVFVVAEDPPDEPVDVVVSSSERAKHGHGATVVCGSPPDAGRATPAEHVFAHLPREAITSGQLIAAVRAASVGLYVLGTSEADSLERRFDRRRRDVLRLLAQGADTRGISRALRYSERTVKELIHNIEHDLHARNRAHAVAVAIRQGLI